MILLAIERWNLKMKEGCIFSIVVMLYSLRHFNEGESTRRKKENDTFYTGQQKKSTTSMKQQERMDMSNEKRSCRQRRRRRRSTSSSWSRRSRKSCMFSLVSILLALFVPSHHLHYQLRECYAFTANPDHHHHQRPSSRSQFMTRNRDYYQLATRRRQKKMGSSTSIRMAASMLQPQGRQPQQQAGQGLSPYFQAILSRTNERQRFVTGKYPVIVTIQECQTRKWLNLGRSDEKGGGATSLVLVNNTQIEKSLASFTRFQWLDETDRQQQQDGEVMSMELLAEIHTAKPGYLHIMPSDGAGSSAATLREAQYMTIPRWNKPQPKSISSALYEQLEDLKWKGPYRDRLWVSGFTLAGRKGILKSMDVNSGHITSVNSRSEAMALWPNEVHSVPTNLVQQPTHTTTTASGGETSTKTMKKQSLDDAILVSDGFLVPGKDRGGIYVVQKPGNENSEWTICLTDRDDKNRWFYHRAVWIDLTGDGRQSILTARAKLRKVKTNNGRSEVFDSRPKNGQLVWLEMPKPHRFDEATGTPLEEDGTVFDPFSTRHVPWKERVLATGPDVMFNVADMDSTDDTIEVISSQFFDKKVTLHSINVGPKPRISFSRVIDNRCGAAFGGTFADLDPSCRLEENYHRVIETGGSAGTVEPGSSFSHLLVTSHECNYVAVESETTSTATTTAETANGQHNEKNEPNRKSIAIDGGSLFSYRVPPGKENWKTEEWVRTTVATGFRVKSQLWNVINPGAPGFVYTFHAHKDDRKSGKRPLIAVAGDCAESAFIFRPDDDDGIKNEDSHAKYKLMSEIKCGATVGSIGIGYEDLCSDDVEQEPGYAKLYIPCYEKDKILVFALGSGEDAAIDYIDDDGW